MAFYYLSHYKEAWLETDFEALVLLKTLIREG